MNYTRINFQRLLDVCKATEIGYTDVFSMSYVVRRGFCGTAGCLIGNYNLMSCRPEQSFGHLRDAEYFGITYAEYRWLFSDCVIIGKLLTFRRNLSIVTKEQALARLRKFIYYKLHKQEMILDDNGVTEHSRRAEGDQHFVRRAVESYRQLESTT